MDPLFLGGLLLALLAVVVATLIDGNSFGALVGPSSLVLVVFGSLGATLMSARLSELSSLPKAAVVALTGKGVPDVDEQVTQLAGLAEVVRKEGVLALEARMEDIDDAFLQRGIQLLVDGQDAEQIAEVLQIDIAALDERHQRGIGFFKTLGGYAPTVGMLGTVIGLVNMLGNLSDPAQLGIGMALALLTTLYGVAFANLVFLPFATKLEKLNELELSARDVVLDGVLCIQAGMSPRLLVERLETYLPPAQRVGHAARAGAPTPLPGSAQAAA
jgi:chemotaxis protein MotA